MPAEKKKPYDWKKAYMERQEAYANLHTERLEEEAVVESLKFHYRTLIKLQYSFWRRLRFLFRPNV